MIVDISLEATSCRPGQCCGGRDANDHRGGICIDSASPFPEPYLDLAYEKGARMKRGARMDGQVSGNKCLN
jgi:hypothetical protein